MQVWKKSACALLAAALLTGSLTFPINAQVKLIAITFDDGPHSTFTTQVVEVLNSRRVKGTFFLVGKWLPGKRDLVLSMAEEGHQIANHTFSHEALTGLRSEEIFREVRRTDSALEDIVGPPFYMVRPPYGLRSDSVIAQVPAPVILWSIDAAKGKQISGSRMARFILSSARDGDIILLHDTTQNNLDAVATVVDGLHAKGFEFVTVEELFRLRGVVPQNGVAYRRVIDPAPQYWDELALDRHWAWDSIRLMQDRGYMAGTGQGWYPNRYLTRSTAVTALWRACGAPAPQARATGFSDVLQGSWCDQAVSWGKEQGLTRGLTARRFGAEEGVTREQLYVMVARLVASQPLPVLPAATYRHYGDDNRISSYARDSVALLRRLGFSSANDVELFRPGDFVTRAEAAELFSWYLGLEGV